MQHCGAKSLMGLESLSPRKYRASYSDDNWRIRIPEGVKVGSSDKLFRLNVIFSSEKL